MSIRVRKASGSFMTDKDQTEDGKRAVGGLARKLAASKEGTAGTGGSLTLKALRRSVARAAEDLCELPMAVIAARQTNRVPEDLPSVRQTSPCGSRLPRGTDRRSDAGCRCGYGPYSTADHGDGSRHVRG